MRCTEIIPEAWASGGAQKGSEQQTCLSRAGAAGPLDGTCGPPLRSLLVEVLLVLDPLCELLLSPLRLLPLAELLPLLELQNKVLLVSQQLRIGVEVKRCEHDHTC